jgi:pimeloyl-ACP methyl ester carboxylesterase
VTRRRKRAIIRVALVVAFVFGARAYAQRLVYHPKHDDGTGCPPGMENVSFVSEDGTKLHGWLQRVPGATRAVLMAHGNAGDVEQRPSEISAIAEQARAHAFMFDYRGFGRSEGTPYEAGVCADARAALAALEKAVGVPPSRTVVIGHSLGGAVGIDLATRAPVAGLVVLSSFTSIDDMVRFRLGAPLGFMCPEVWDSEAKIATIKCPKLIVHGDKDALVPYPFGWHLFEVAAEPKHFSTIQGGDHNTFDDALGEVVRFVDTCAKNVP